MEQADLVGRLHHVARLTTSTQPLHRMEKRAASAGQACGLKTGKVCRPRLRGCVAYGWAYMPVVAVVLD